MLNEVKIATPISNLFSEIVDANKIIEVSSCLECRDHSINANYSLQEIFHCELQPIHNFNRKEINYLKKIKSVKKDLKLISFHLASCYKNPKLIDGKFYPRGKKISKPNLLYNAKKNLSLIKEIFGNNIKIAVENNNYFKTEAYDYVCEPSFINSIVMTNNIFFLFDIAHAKISAHNMNISQNDYKYNLPLSKTIQVHIAKPGFNLKNEIFDKHDLPTENEITESLNLKNEFCSIEYFTVEYYKNTDKLIKFLNLLKSKLK